MNSATEHMGLVLAVHPTSRGFGWVLFEDPRALVDWGIASAKQSRSGKVVARFERLLKRYEPAVLVLEAYEGEGSRRAECIQKLCASMLHVATAKGLATAVYPRHVVQECFASVGANSRHDIAEAVARHLDTISHRLPRKRKIWESEDPRQSLFDAAALALTHYTATFRP